jgi:hypothetical protein
MDHSQWSEFLERYVTSDASGVNRVAYAQVDASARLALADYLQRLQAVAIGNYNRDEQLAYWINLYNAATLRVVLEHYPVESIRDIDISPGLFSDGPWDHKLLRVEDEALSLNDIEHRILRPIWRDPRIHYAVNCASVGCPNLRREAYRGESIDAQLEQAARDYVNDPRGARVTERGLFVSSIYDWFQEDFGGSEPAVIAHLRRYAEPALAKRLAGVRSIAGTAYDWSLNERMTGG